MPIHLRMIWRTQKDAEVCPICRALDGYTWTLGAGDPHPTHLLHPSYGPVYDMRPAAVCSTVKEEEGHVCRCSLRYEFDVSIPSPKNNSSTSSSNKSLA